RHAPRACGGHAETLPGALPDADSAAFRHASGPRRHGVDTDVDALRRVRSSVKARNPEGAPIMYRYTMTRSAMILGLLSIVVLSGCGRMNSLTAPEGTSVQTSHLQDRVPMRASQKPAQEPMPVAQIQTDYVGEWANAAR